MQGIVYVLKTHRQTCKGRLNETLIECELSSDQSENNERTAVFQPTKKDVKQVAI